MQKGEGSDLDENHTAVLRVPELSTLFIIIMLGQQSLSTDHTDCEQSFTITSRVELQSTHRHLDSSPSPSQDSRALTSKFTFQPAVSFPLHKLS